MNEPKGTPQTEEGCLAAMRSMRDDILTWIKKTFIDV